MKAGITVDDGRTTQYVLGKYDFYTRTVTLDDEVAEKIQTAERLHELSQRILSSLYNSNGRFVNPEDLKEFECLSLATYEEEATPEAASEKTPKKRASAVRSSNESQKD